MWSLADPDEEIDVEEEKIAHILQATTIIIIPSLSLTKPKQKKIFQKPDVEKRSNQMRFPVQEKCHRGPISHNPSPITPLYWNHATCANSQIPRIERLCQTHIPSLFHHRPLMSRP